MGDIGTITTHMLILVVIVPEGGADRPSIPFRCRETEALHTQSRTTIFRVLSAAGYLTSYSHAGRYYTLKRIPKFDSHGIWLHRDIGFSLHGTLRATVTHIVEKSPAGQTHGELQDMLQLRVHDTLRLLIQDHALTRKQFQDAYLYLSSKPKRASAQWAQRQQLAATVIPAQMEPSRVIDVLVDVIRHPSDDAGAVSRRLRALGQSSVTAEQVEAVFTRYDLKKTARSR
jgi:hypothetical protein